MAQDDTIDSYIARVLPCQPPCDSFGVCDNCCDATLIRIGADIERRGSLSLIYNAATLIKLAREKLPDGPHGINVPLKVMMDGWLRYNEKVSK